MCFTGIVERLCLATTIAGLTAQRPCAIAIVERLGGGALKCMDRAEAIERLDLDGCVSNSTAQLQCLLVTCHCILILTKKNVYLADSCRCLGFLCLIVVRPPIQQRFLVLLYRSAE